jgi:ribonuclease HI
LRNSGQVITIYTDGSCHTQHRIGGWVALVFINEEKIVLSGVVHDTTHNRMELTAVIEAVQYVRHNYKTAGAINIFTDSQYVVGLVTERKQKLHAKDFQTKKGNIIQNADLVKELLAQDTAITLHFTKVKAHQKKTAATEYNIEADKLSRKIVRDAVRNE